MTLKELIQRIKVVALETAPGDVRPLLVNTEVLTEVLLPRCFDALIDRVSRTPEGVASLRTQKTVAFVGGVAAFPTDVREEHYELMTFHDDLGTSYISNWFEFNLDPPVGENPNDYSRFTVNNGNIYYHRVGFARGTFTGDRTISFLTRPQLPTLESDQVVLRDQLLQMLVTFTASVVNGSTPLSDIGLDYHSLERVEKRAEQSS